MGLGGVEQQGHGGGRVLMDERRMVKLSGVVLASSQWLLGLARSMRQYLH